MENEDYEIALSNSFTGKLIKQVEELLKKPRLDGALTEKLDTFLFKLQQSQLALQYGVLDTNFAEAGLLLELTKNVWCKKVDLFGNEVLSYLSRVSSYDAEIKTRNEASTSQSQEILNSQCNKQETNPENSINLQIDVQDKKQRRKKKNAEPNLMYSDFFKEVQSLNDFTEQTFITDESLVNNYRKAERLGLQTYPIPLKNESLLFPVINYRNLQHIKDLKDDEDAIYAGKLKSVVMMENLASWKLRPLFDELSFSLYTDLALQPQFQARHLNNQFNENLLMFRNEWYGKYSDIPNDREEKDPFEEGYNLLFKMRHIPTLKARSDRLSTISIPLKDVDHLERYRCFVKLERLTPAQTKGINDISSCDDEIIEAFEEIRELKIEIRTPSISESALTPNSTGAVITPGIPESALIPSESEPLVQISELNEVNQLESENLDQSTNFESALTPSESVVATSESNEIGLSDSENLNESITFETFENDVCINSTTFLTPEKCNSSKESVPEDSILKRKSPSKENGTPVKEKRSKKPRPVKLRILATMELKAFEFFYCQNYNAEENEGQPKMCIMEMTPNATSSEIDPEERSLFDTFDDCLNNNETGEKPQDAFNDFDSGIDLSQSSDENRLTLSQSTVISKDSGISLSQSIIQPDDDECCLNIEDNEVLETFQVQQLDAQAYDRLYEWKHFIGQRFAEMETVPKFDIHEYGTTVLNELPEDGTKLFKNIARPGQLARYFQACLELANKGNIEFGSVQTGEVSNDTLSVKLLSKDRHHVAVNDFVLSSAQMLSDRLKLANAVRKGVRRKFSTPSGEARTVKRNYSEMSP